MNQKKLKLGLLGGGSFASVMLPTFQAHPLVDEIYLAEALPSRRKLVADYFGIRHTFAGVDDLCASDCDAVLVFTQRHLHGPHALAALQAGKHVYCAVPAANSIQELHDICRKTAETGLVYMMGETSYYYPAQIYCRERYRAGDFGKFVYGEGEYLHDMAHGFYEAFRNSGGEHWKRVAGVPPMYYPTHSISMVLGAIGARMTQVSCLGYRDEEGDDVFGDGKNHWNNPFSNQSALFRTSDGGMARINEFRRVGMGKGNSVRLSLFGTHGVFEQQADDHHVWTAHDHKRECLDEILDCADLRIPEGRQIDPAIALDQQGFQADFRSAYAKVHPIDRLPSALRASDHNGHYGSHHFLVDDFVKSVAFGLLPPVHVWEAAKYTAPGLIAHQSSLNEGAITEIPDFGSPSADWDLLEANMPFVL